MLASVYDFDSREFSYYRLPSKAQLGSSFGAPTRTPSGFASPIGEAPESLTMPLPDGATYVGSGKVPKGIVCRDPSGALGDITIGTDTVTGSISTVGVIAGVAVGLWIISKSKPGKWLRKKLWD